MNRKQHLFSRALVTGATSGIGEDLCHVLAKNGIPLLITGRNVDRLNQLTTTLQSQADTISFPADLSTAEGRQAVIDNINEHTPNLIINNAGFGLYGDAWSHTTHELMDILTVNANAVLQITMEAAQTLRAHHQHGVIMNIASVAAFHACPNNAVYGAAKSFVVQLSQALDFEMAPHGIRVLTACPGVVATNFNNRAGGVNPSQNFLTMTSTFAANEIWKQIQSGKRCHLFDWKYRLITFLGHFLPVDLKAKLIQQSISDRLKK